MRRCYKHMQGAANLKIEEGCWLQALETEQQGEEAQVWATVNVSIGHIFCAPSQVLSWAAQNPAHSVRICSPTNQQQHKATVPHQRHNLLVGPSKPSTDWVCWGANSPPAKPCTQVGAVYKRLLRCGTKNSACSALCLIAAHQRELHQTAQPTPRSLYTTPVYTQLSPPMQQPMPLTPARLSMLA